MLGSVLTLQWDCLYTPDPLNLTDFTHGSICMEVNISQGPVIRAGLCSVFPSFLLKTNKQMTTTARTKSKQNKSQSYTFFLNRLTVWCQSSFKSEVTGTTSMRTSFLLLFFLKIKGKHRAFSIKPKQMSHQGQSPTAHHQSGTSRGCRCKRNQPMWFICSRCHQAVV